METDNRQSESEGGCLHSSDPGGDWEKYKGKPKREKPNERRFTLGRAPFRMKGEVQLTELLPGDFFEAYGVGPRAAPLKEWACCAICNGVDELKNCELTHVKKRAVCHECLEKFSKPPLGLSAATILLAVDMWEPEEKEWQPFDNDEDGEFFPEQKRDEDEVSWNV